MANRFTPRTFATCFSALLLASVAMAAEPPAEKPGAAKDQHAAPMQFSVRNHISGKLSDLHQKSVEGAQRVFGCIDLKSGEKINADFGSPDETKELNLKNGERVTVSGPLARFSDELLVLAQQVKANGKSADIERKLCDISGKVTAMQFTALLVTEATAKQAEELGTSHLLAAVTEKDGKRTWIDFGPGRNLAKLRLQPGDELSVDGALTAFPSGDVLVARDIQKGNQKHTVDWRRAVLIRTENQQNSQPGNRQGEEKESPHSAQQGQPQEQK